MNTEKKQIFALKHNNNNELVFLSLNDLKKQGIFVSPEDVGPEKLFSLNNERAVACSLQTGQMTFVTREYMKGILERTYSDPTKRTLVDRKEDFAAGHWMRFAAKPKKAYRPASTQDIKGTVPSLDRR